VTARERERPGIYNLPVRVTYQDDLMYCRIVVQQQPSTVPVFLLAAGHPVRWGLLGALARGDRQVHELTALVGHPQNLVSYHLRQLREAGLVRARRSAADGRDTYYHLDLAGCGRLLAAVGAGLHPALHTALHPAPRTPAATLSQVSVLFLCTGNSARSQMAEALLRQRAAAAWPNAVLRVCSAGSHPKPLHPGAVAVMAERGIDLAGARPKHLSEFTEMDFDYVITLCDRVREVCPPFPGHAETIHWSLPDPASEPDGYLAFGRTADELSERIGYLLHHIVLRGWRRHEPVVQ
jgi:protein-tyrosine-phosphatase/DNA-binding transcriptional ArsR family regulator